MNLSKEKAFAIVGIRMGKVDGNFSTAEINRLVDVADANGLDLNLVVAACKEELENPCDFAEVLASIKDEEIRDICFFGACRVAAADDVLSLKELQRIFAIADVWDWSGAYVAIKILKMLKKCPELKVEGID